MNGAWTDVENILDLLDHIWIGLVLIAVAAVPSIFAHRNGKKLDAVKNQVQNQHETNLRDDIDRAIAAVEMLAHDVRGLRSDLMAEEDRRRQQVQDLYTELDHRTGKHRRI